MVSDMDMESYLSPVLDLDARTTFDWLVAQDNTGLICLIGSS